MNRIRRLRRRAALAAVALTALAVGLTSVAAPASASTTPPTADPTLPGAWVNVDAGSRSLAQIVIGRTETGGITVDAFGACTPTPCEFGAVPATVYGTSVSSTTGTTFQAHQNTGAFAERTLTGTLGRGASGPRLSVTLLSTFLDGSGRHNYVVTDTFAPGSGVPASAAGTVVTPYATGNPPKLPAASLGSWTNTNAATTSITRIDVGGSAANPTVHAYGRCSPTDCDLGAIRAITFGKSISAAKGSTALASYEFGFSRTQLVLNFTHSKHGDSLSVAKYTEFTDGSGRSNYSLTETFAKS